jgi:hypothetical protein
MTDKSAWTVIQAGKANAIKNKTPIKMSFCAVVKRSKSSRIFF